MNIDIKVLNRRFYDVIKLDGCYYDTPQYQTPGAAGLDLKATEDFILAPGETITIDSGLALDIKDPNVMAVIVPRSSLGSKGLVLANTIGVIDSDYQGEIKLCLLNRKPSRKNELVNHWITEPGSIKIAAGSRIAQLIFLPVIKVSFKVVDDFDNKTKRGVGGFGSTGR